MHLGTGSKKQVHTQSEWHTQNANDFCAVIIAVSTLSAKNSYLFTNLINQ